MVDTPVLFFLLLFSIHLAVEDILERQRPPPLGIRYFFLFLIASSVLKLIASSGI